MNPTPRTVLQPPVGLELLRLDDDGALHRCPVVAIELSQLFDSVESRRVTAVALDGDMSGDLTAAILMPDGTALDAHGNRHADAIAWAAWAVEAERTASKRRITIKAPLRAVKG